MIAQIASFSEMITLVGGGKLTEATVSDLLTLAPILVACDGAAQAALDMGRVPQLVIGDLDSLSADTRARLDPETVIEIAEQETTDFDKALRSLDAPLVLGAGFMGGRLDHELACYNALVRNADRPCILVGEEDVVFHAAGPVALDVAAGTRVSLFPMAEVEVTAEGLEWPLDALRLAPWGRVGTSNRATGSVTGPVRIAPDGPGLLVILPRAVLGAAIAALR